MSITLFPHNQTAYESLLNVLSTDRRACVIHPTGTGKSFLGFKYCEDHPGEQILWLSPSEYIFKTQCESLRALGESVPANINFMTYAKLSLQTKDDLTALHPDTIILDEMHRAAAPTWEQPVQTLLANVPEPSVIGLTATSIRYLDGQKDTTATFNLTVASEMSLGEAIVRGILQPPRYVLTVFSYQKELEHAKRRIKSAKNSASREAAEECFEKLRRALEHAEGLDTVFDRHMTDRTGKYLVFCSNAEHMDEMIAKVPEWFHKVDPNPNIYRAYAEDAGTAKAFQAFKADTSEHLKLLFCIDMLNEGVHVDGVSGVILLRPTISPIIYKQQIGRALAAGAKKDAVIFDIVLNIENLYSIGSIEEEMRAAITYYRYLGEYENIVNESFQVIDETQDCKRLFAELEQRLSCSWDLMLAEAKQYYSEHGDLLVPAKYKTATGISLGNWLNLQRKIYNGKAEGFLTEEQIAALDSLGIVWDSYLDRTWEKNYLEAKAYFEKFGDLLVPIKYVTDTGFPLGVWIMRMRQAKANEREGVVTKERIQKLEEIGMRWDVLGDQWEKNYQEAVAYFRANGNLLVPGRYISPNGLKLGNWIAHLRRIRSGKARGSLSEEQITRLNAIGMAWDADEERWRIGYEAAVNYSRKNGGLNVPTGFETEDGYRLGMWIQLKRRQYKQGSLTKEQVAALEAIGMRWDVNADRWLEMYAEAKAYYEANGDLKVPKGYKTANGANLNSWVGKMKRERQKLSSEQISALRDIGMRWEEKDHLQVAS